MLASASLGEDAALLDLLVEAAQGALERLVLTHSDFCQSRDHLPRPGMLRFAPRVGRRSRGGPDERARTLGRRLAESSRGPRTGQPTRRASKGLAEAPRSGDPPQPPATAGITWMVAPDATGELELGRFTVDEHVDVLADGRSGLEDAVRHARPRRVERGDDLAHRRPVHGGVGAAAPAGSWPASGAG